MIRYALLFIAVLGWLAGHSQSRRALPTDHSAFLKQFQKKMAEASGNSPQARMVDDTTYSVIEELTLFNELWKQQVFEGLEDTFIAVVNEMIRRRMRWVPDIFQVMLMMNISSRLGVDQQQTGQWLRYIHQALKQRHLRSSDIRRLNQTAYLLLKYHILIWRRGYQWRLGDERYSWQPRRRVVHIGPVDLLGTSPNDTLVLHEVEGDFDPLSGVLEGRGGILTWIQFNRYPDEISARLPRHYRMNLRKSSFTIDSAVLVYPERLPRPLLGKVEAKIYLQGSRKKRRFPRFRSYEAEMTLKDLTPGVHYMGGFGLEGLSIAGIATENDPARIIIERNNRKAVELAAERVRIHPDRLVTDKALMNIYWDDEIITGQNVNAKIFYDTRKASFNLKGMGAFHPPLYDPYHSLLIRARYMDWMLDSPTIHIRALYGNIREVHFKSTYYFNLNEYDLFRGILPYDPVRKLVLMAQRRQRNNFDIEEVAIEFGNDTRYGIIPLLVNMANQGLLHYSTADSTITILPRAFHMVKAKQGKVDYDNIHFTSRVKRGTNAVMDWNTRDLTAYGVYQIHISDSQGVVFFPNGTVRVKKRLHMLFSGSYTAALMNFTGDSFYFNYDSFYVSMPVIDSAVLFYYDTLPDGSIGPMAVNTPLQDLEGTLYIDSPNNKSGLKDNPRYPIFISKQGGYAYYDDSTIGAGGYDREKVFFELYPFQLDSLNALTEESFGLAGKFSSGGIFPDFETDLILMPDRSLGFRYDAPAEGFNLYGEKGKGQLTILMDRQGLGGNGVIEHLGARMHSTRFLFTEDSVIGHVDSFYLAHNTRNIYPLTRGHDFPVRWYPREDTLILLPTSEHPVYAYEDSIQLVGKVVMTPQRLISYGKFTYQRAEVTALEYLHLKPTQVSSPRSIFRILTDKKGEYAMESKDVSITLDLEKKYARAKANSDTSVTVFPYNKFSTTVRNYQWNLKDNNIVFDVRGTADTNNALFTSLLPEAGGLTISSPYAVYDINSFRITANDVRYIEVDDSWVIPDSGRVVIEKGGRLPFLHNAVILADKTHQYHRIIHADLTIKGKYEISGQGVYPYQTVTGAAYQLPVGRIFISPEDSLLRADITVPDTMNFYPHPRFQFTGTMKMVCARPELTFDGFLRTRSRWPAITTDWLPLQGGINARHFRVPIASPVTSKDNLHLHHGFYLAPDSFGAFYPRFLKPLLNDGDIPIATSPETFLYYDSLEQAFRIEDKRYDTLDEGVDSFYSYRLSALEQTGEVTVTSSDIHLLSPAPVLRPYIGGTIQRDTLLKRYYRLDLSAAFDLPLPPELMTLLGDTLANIYFQEETTPDLSDRMLFCLKNWLAPQQPHVYSELITTLTEEELWTPHENFAPTFIFSELKMMWNNELGMFISIDTPGLSGMAQSGVSQKVFGFVAIRPANTNPLNPDQALYIYFEPSPTFWFFIRVKGDEVGIVLSDPELLDQYTSKIKKLSKRKARVRILDFAERDIAVGQILPVVTSYYRRY